MNIEGAYREEIIRRPSAVIKCEPDATVQRLKHYVEILESDKQFLQQTIEKLLVIMGGEDA